MARAVGWTAAGFTIGCAVGYTVATHKLEAVDSAVHAVVEQAGAVVEQAGAHLKSAWATTQSNIKKHLPEMLPDSLKKKLLDACPQFFEDGRGGGGGGMISSSGTSSKVRSTRSTVESIIAEEDASTPASPTASTAAGSEALALASSAAAAGSGGGGERLKVVVVVRDDAAARWPPAKLAVAVSSSILSLYKRCYANRTLRPQLLAWEAQKGGGPKVVLRAPDEASLGKIMEEARAAGIPAHALLESAPGRTADGAPRRARTLIALGPATAASFEAIGAAALASI